MTQHPGIGVADGDACLVGAVGRVVRRKQLGQCKRGAASQLGRSIERITQMPRIKQKFVIGMLETVLSQPNG